MNTNILERPTSIQPAAKTAVRPGQSIPDAPSVEDLEQMFAPADAATALAQPLAKLPRESELQFFDSVKAMILPGIKNQIKQLKAIKAKKPEEILAALKEAIKVSDTDKPFAEIKEALSNGMQSWQESEGSKLLAAVDNTSDRDALTSELDKQVGHLVDNKVESFIKPNAEGNVNLAEFMKSVNPALKAALEKGDTKAAVAFVDALTASLNVRATKLNQDLAGLDPEKLEEVVTKIFGDQEDWFKFGLFQGLVNDLSQAAE